MKKVQLAGHGYAVIPVGLFDSGLTCGAIAVAAYLSSVSGAHGTAFPSQARIGRAVGLTRKSVRGHLDDLETAGIISSDDSGASGVRVYKMESKGWVKITQGWVKTTHQTGTDSLLVLNTNTNTTSVSANTLSPDVVFSLAECFAKSMSCPVKVIIARVGKVAKTLAENYLPAQLIESAAEYCRVTEPRYISPNSWAARVGQYLPRPDAPGAPKVKSVWELDAELDAQEGSR